MIRRRTPIARSSAPIDRTPLPRSRKRIPQRSPRVLAQVEHRAAVVEAAMNRDRWECQARSRLVATEIPGPADDRYGWTECGGPLDPHEIIPRSAWHAGQYELENVLTVCRRHHDWIGAFPDAAHALGLHGYSWERPA